MLNITELKIGMVFQEDRQLLQVLSYEHTKMGRGSGNVKVKVRNLKTGSVVEKSFITGARVEEAEVDKKKAQFLYQDGDSYNFMDPVSFEQFSLPENVLGEQAQFLKEGLEVTLLVFEEQALALELPNNLIYTITETGPAEKGNSVSNVFKTATLDNNLEVKVPMFIKVGDKVKVDTRSGAYIERAK